MHIFWNEQLFSSESFTHLHALFLLLFSIFSLPQRVMGERLKVSDG